MCVYSFVCVWGGMCVCVGVCVGKGKGGDVGQIKDSALTWYALALLFTRPVSSYPPASSHSPSLSLFHPLFFPLWVCSLLRCFSFFGGNSFQFQISH